MSEHERDERGQFQPEHGDRAYLEAVVAREPAGTSEIAEELGVTRQNADRRLRQLESDGAVTSKKVGQSLVWQLVDETRLATPVDPDDSFWDAQTYAGEEMSAEEIDDVLYG
jgi:predicted ArsR family transcriptional regulator